MKPGRGRGLLPVLVALVPVLAASNAPCLAGRTALEARNESFELLNEGMRLYKAERYRDAIPVLKEAAGISLNSFMAHYYLGLTYNALHQYEEAIPPLRLSVELEPDHIQAHIAMGDAYLKQGDISESRAEFLRALELQEDYAPALEGLGRLHESIGDDDLAIDYYERALRINAAYPDTYISLGDLYLRLGRTEDAVQLFLEAIRLRPDFAPAYHRLAQTYYHQKRYQLAIAAIRRAEEQAPNQALYPTLLGIVYLEKGCPTRGLEKLKRAMELDPDFPRPFRELAAWYRRQFEFDRAIATLEQALEGDIRDREMREDTEREKRQYEAEAAELDSLEAAHSDDPDQPAHLLALAGFSFRIGAYERAVEFQRQAVALLGDPRSGRADLGYYLTLAGHFEEAAAVLGELVVESPQDAVLQFDLAVARSGLGDYRGAEAHLERALAIRPDLAAAHLVRGNVRYRLGDPAGAEASYREYLRLDPDGEEVPRIHEIVRRLEEKDGAVAAGDRSPGGGEGP